jgi:hypothetical protein
VSAFSVTKAKAKKANKRGPEEKRLVITEEPETALARLLKVAPKK